MTRFDQTSRDQLPAGLTAGGIVFELVLAAAGDGEPDLPDWIQLTPRGEVTARDGRRFVFDPERLAATFVTDGLKLPIDFEHEAEFTMLLGAKPARSWIVELAARAEGLFGRVEWLPEGAAAVRAKHYRYISPSFWRDADGATARLMKGAALVASPALGMPSLASSSFHPELPMKEILAALGLTETATATDAVAAIALLKAGDPQHFVPRAQHEAVQTALAEAQDRLAAADAAAQAARCSSLVEEAIRAGKIVPAARDQYLALARADIDATKAAIDAMPVILQAGAEKTVDPSAGAPGQISEAERAMARALGLTDEAFLAARAA